MKYLKDPIEKEIVIDKSRFICQLHPVSSIEEIEDILTKIRKEHREANHNCYAYTFDHMRLMKASDDGEPQKTAGVPMLEVLKHHELTDVLAVVTRYFGGIKLGAGGLVRAYTNAVTNALLDATLGYKNEKDVYEVLLPYHLYDTFLYQTKDKAIILDQVFESEIRVILYFNSSNIETLNQFFNNQLNYAFKEKLVVFEPLK